MISATLAFLLGIISLQQFPQLPAIGYLVVLIAVMVFLAIQHRWLLLYFAAGLLWAWLFAQWRLADNLSDGLQNKFMTVEGYIASLPEQQGNRSSFDFVVSKPTVTFPDKIHLSWYSPPQSIKAGQSWRFNVKLKQPHGLLNPEGFDYQTWLFANRIGATGYINNKLKPVQISAVFSVARYFSVWRQSVSDRLDAALPQGQQLGIIKALTIGDQHAINAQQWAVFNNTGATHLMVISGSHISLIAGMIFVLVRRGWAWTGVLRFSPQSVAAIAAWIAAMFYAGLAGYSIPTLRAVIMLTVVMLTVIWQRNTVPIHTLMLALLAVLVFDPLAVLSIGFWLSFLAVALLIYISSNRLGRGLHWQQAIKAQLATAIGLSPLLIVFFQKVSLIAPLVNWLTAPLVELLVVPLALISVAALYILPALAPLILSVTDSVLQGVWYLLTTLSKLPLASIDCLPPPWYATITSAIASLLLLAPRGLPARYLGVFLFLPLVVVSADKPKPAAVWLTLLDVGQGLSAVVQTTQHVLVFDTGAKYSEESDMGESVVVPYLHKHSLEHIDTLLISHNDNDHSGGAESVLKDISVDEILSSAPEWLVRPNARYCQAGQQWQWDEVTFRILSPPQTAFSSENNNSCVLQIDNGRDSFLLTGDIEHAAEDELVAQYGNQLSSTVLIAPHHGSKTSSSQAFLQQVMPEFVLIPSGYLNRFKFPHKEVLQRYRQLDIHWLNTAEQGAINVYANPEGIRMETEYSKRKRYWMKEIN